MHCGDFCLFVSLAVQTEPSLYILSGCSNRIPRAGRRHRNHLTTPLFPGGHSLRSGSWPLLLLFRDCHLCVLMWPEGESRPCTGWCLGTPSSGRRGYLTQEPPCVLSHPSNSLHGCPMLRSQGLLLPMVAALVLDEVGRTTGAALASPRTTTHPPPRLPSIPNRITEPNGTGRFCQALQYGDELDNGRKASSRSWS